MDLSSLLTTNDTPAPARGKSFYPSSATTTTPHVNGAATTPKSLSPSSDFKAVSFRLRESHCEPKPFHIRPHDSTDCIMDTVKHLFGVSRQYDLGISLEDSDGLSFIPSYENFTDGMMVYVRIEESLPNSLVYRHSYNLRQSQGISNGTSRSSAYPNSRSVSPHSRGRRSTSATAMQMGNGRGRSLKRSAQYLDLDAEQDLYHHDGFWYQLPHQSHLPDDEEEPRTKAASVASADISVENIVEGSRRKRPKFSSDELPLFPPPALPKQNGSVSSLSPPRPITQLATPYSHRNFSFSHPTPPSNAGDYAMYHSSGPQTPYGVSAVVPTPAPTVTSCISDEDVAIQLMRLGNVNAGSNATSTMDDCRDGFSSDCGEYGDDGRSDTTELPDPLPPTARDGLPDSPILYPGSQKFKSLDEILPSFDTTEPSDDENQPPDNPFPVPSSHHSQASHISAGRYARMASDYEDEGDGFDDEGDETYVVREEEDENDADYEDDLDDVPLKMRRERKMSAAPVPQPKPKQHSTKGIAKVIKRHPASILSKPRPIAKPHHDHHYPISPASPPASRKPSVASSGGNKSRSNTIVNHGMGTPFSQDQPHHHLLAPFDGQVPGEEPRPRCQRCRKSKKGCDRQRPCQRCKDAGIPPDQCISEDEAGTRRGRQAAAAAKKAGMANGIMKPKPKKKKKVV